MIQLQPAGQSEQRGLLYFFFERKSFRTGKELISIRIIQLQPASGAARLWSGWGLQAS